MDMIRGDMIRGLVGQENCPSMDMIRGLVTKLKVRLSLLLSKQGILRNGRDPVAESGHSGQD